MKISKSNQRRLIAIVVIALLFYWSFPKLLFHVPYSTVINDERGDLLSARIADDGQWRFPTINSVPSQLKECILQFEDEYFFIIGE